jgi:hypothetical protein
MNMNVIPVPLVALIGIYAIAKVILDTTRDLHSLRDTILRTRKLEVTHPVDIARIRVTALTNSYIPLWQGICNAHVVLIIVFILIAIFEVGSKSTPITNSIDINNQNIKISIQSTNTIGMNPDNINSQKKPAEGVSSQVTSWWSSFFGRSASSSRTKRSVVAELHRETRPVPGRRTAQVVGVPEQVGQWDLGHHLGDPAVLARLLDQPTATVDVPEIDPWYCFGETTTTFMIGSSKVMPALPSASRNASRAHR